MCGGVHSAVFFIMNLMNGVYSTTTIGGTPSFWRATLTVSWEMAVASCGYLGAVRVDRQLTCCFWSCNLIFTLVAVITFIQIHLILRRAQNGCDEVDDQQTCGSWMGSPMITCLLYLNTMLSFLRGASSFWLGYKLCVQLDHHIRIEHVPVPVTTRRVSTDGSSTSDSRGEVVVSAATTVMVGLDMDAPLRSANAFSVIVTDSRVVGSVQELTTVTTGSDAHMAYTSNDEDIEHFSLSVHCPV